MFTCGEPGASPLNFINPKMVAAANESVTAMAMIEFEEGAIQVDATIVAEGLGIEPSLVQERMREGTITSLCERGIDDDSGRYRLTFFSKNRRLRLVVEEGNLIQRSVLEFLDCPLPVSAHKPGG